MTIQWLDVWWIEIEMFVGKKNVNIELSERSQSVSFLLSSSGKEDKLSKSKETHPPQRGCWEGAH